MKSRLVNLQQLSGKKASVYTIVTEQRKVPFFDRFIEEHRAAFLHDLMNIAGRLKSIGHVTGAKPGFFKADEGLEWDDGVCALFDTPEKHLRLYCIRFSDQIIVVGGGGPKNVRAWQDDPKLCKEVHEMMHYSKIIRTGLQNGSLRISGNGLRFEGNLILTR